MVELYNQLPIWIGNNLKDLFLMETVFWWRVAGLQVSSATWKRKALTSREEDAGHKVLGGGAGEGAGR